MSDRTVASNSKVGSAQCVRALLAYLVNAQFRRMQKPPSFNEVEGFGILVAWGGI